MKAVKISEDRHRLLQKIEDLLDEVCSDDAKFSELVDKLNQIFEKAKGEKSGTIAVAKLIRFLGGICKKKEIIRHDKHASAVDFCAMLVILLLDLGDIDVPSSKSQEASIRKS